MKYTIIIPTYNHCNNLLKPCLESIIQYTDLDQIEIIIVANGCTDNTKEYVESLGSPFKLIWIESAAGYPVSVNAGIKESTGDYVILLNNDIVLLPQEKNQWLNQLLTPFNNPRVGLSGPKIGWHYGLMAFGIMFYCVMIKREVFNTIGLLDEIYSPGGVEDHDFCHRASLAGFDIADANIKINETSYFPLLHKENQTFKDPSLKFQDILQRNNLIFERKFRRMPKFSIVIPTYNHCDDLLKPCIESIIKYSNLEDLELIIVANGCKDETLEYLKYLESYFNRRALNKNFKYIFDDDALGYSKATNKGIKQATCDKIVLLNNDVVILESVKNRWLDQLDNCFSRDPNCGIACVVKGFSEPAGKDFAVFFCVMVAKKVFDTIGLLNEEYGVGGGEDTEFSIEAVKAGFTIEEATIKRWEGKENLYTGDYPIYHRGEGTVHDPSLVPNWNEIFLRNSLKLAKKYNIDWYRWRISNYLERAVFLKGDPVMPKFPREYSRYHWASQNILGNKVLEIGCSSGYGTQFLPSDIDYTGLDYDKLIVECAGEQDWGPNHKFIHADINKFEIGFYDTIIAFEVIEHLANGLEIVQRLKNHCNRLLITVPRKEPPGYWGPHHLLHLLDESMFPGFEFKYIDEFGNLLESPNENIINLMVCRWDKNV